MRITLHTSGRNKPQTPIRAPIRAIGPHCEHGGAVLRGTYCHQSAGAVSRSLFTPR